MSDEKLTSGGSNLLFWLLALFGIGAGTVYLLKKEEPQWFARLPSPGPWRGTPPRRAPRYMAPTTPEIMQTGPAVVLRQVQAKLGVPVTGENDAATRAAVTAFQRAHRLHVDGAVGPETLGALGIVPLNENEVPQVSTPMTPTDIAHVLASVDSSLSTNSLALILAQFDLETGGFGGGLHNYNYGNYTHITGDGQNYYIGDDKDGHHHPVKHKFVAFTDPQESAQFWITRMKVNRPQAWTKIVEADPQGYVRALKASGYFQSTEAEYLAGVLPRYNKYRTLLQGVA